MSPAVTPSAPAVVSAWTRNSSRLASIVIVPGVSVIEFACVTRPTSVFCEGRKRTSVGWIGNFGDRMTFVTSQADFTISFASHGQ